MDKRGISPLIATVLLIGFTVVLSILVVTWVSNVVEQQTEGTTVNVQAQNQCLDSIGDLTASFSATNNHYPYTVRVTNNGDVSFDFVQIIWQSSSHSDSETTTIANLSGFSTESSTTGGVYDYDKIILVPIIGDVECSTVEINMPEFHYCGDGSCDAGEDSSNCPVDCPPVPGPGNGLCEPSIGEQCTNSGGDCVGEVTTDCQPEPCVDVGAGPQCNPAAHSCTGTFGSGICEQNPTCSPGYTHDYTGDGDCGINEPCCIVEPATCGNNYCDAIYGENCGSCPEDCIGEQAGCSAGYVCSEYSDQGVSVDFTCLISCGSNTGMCFDTQGTGGLCMAATGYGTNFPAGDGDCDQGAPTCCTP